jgi:phosphoribosyl-ATP pyrophosphohydrolase/phosphoribosyl-AMP cyclohydrolase
MLTEQLDWEKTDGMMPAIVQHAVSGEVLMLGYMNKDALEKTEATGKVTFTHAPNNGCGPRVKPRAMSSTW